MPSIDAIARSPELDDALLQPDRITVKIGIITSTDKTFIKVDNFKRIPPSVEDVQGLYGCERLSMSAI
jgi:hypothetical protein